MSNRIQGLSLLTLALRFASLIQKRVEWGCSRTKFRTTGFHACKGYDVVKAAKSWNCAWTESEMYPPITHQDPHGEVKNLVDQLYWFSSLTTLSGWCEGATLLCQGKLDKVEIRRLFVENDQRWTQLNKGGYQAIQLEQLHNYIW